VAAFIAAQRYEHQIPHAVSCRALKVSRSWFYKWHGGSLPPRAARRQRLKAEVAARSERAARIAVMDGSKA
jgi:putative transposase